MLASHLIGAEKAQCKSCGAYGHFSNSHPLFPFGLPSSSTPVLKNATFLVILLCLTSATVLHPCSKWYLEDIFSLFLFYFSLILAKDMSNSGSDGSIDLIYFPIVSLYFSSHFSDIILTHHRGTLRFHLEYNSNSG